MGLSSSKSKQSNEPPKWAKKYIIKGLEQSSRVFDQQQPQLEAFAKDQRDTYGKVAPGAETGILAGQDVINSTLRGDNLMGNPFLQGIIDTTRDSTTNQVNSQFSKAGRYGSGNHGAILARELAAAENAARFNNYGMERGYQNDAVGQAAQYMAGAQGLLNNAAELPWIGVGALNGNVRQASNGYGTQTTTAKPNWGQMLLQGAQQAAAAYAGQGSDPRLKTNVVLVSTDPDGLNWYDFDYRQDMGLDLPKGRQRGVMADEVAKLRHWALGPLIRGEYQTVRYDILETEMAQ